MQALSGRGENVSGGREDGGHGYRLTASLFLRLLALIYLTAFASIAVQIQGLAGAEGITPFTAKLAWYAAEHGVERFWLLPTLFWLDASDLALEGAAIAGCGFSVLLLLNVLPRLSLVFLFLLYLSLYHAGQVFMNFQWDGLLLESGFLAIFLSNASLVTVWLFRFLLFKLRFLSGASKLISGDPTWADLSALQHYFETQPLPNPLSWYAHHLPEWLLRFGAAGTLFVELIIPLMMFMPRPWRFAAAWATILWQLLIMATSNHNWFNLLTIALCLFLFDDRALARVLPGPVAGYLARRDLPVVREGLLYRAGMPVLAALVLAVSVVAAWEMAIRGPAPGWLGTAVDRVEAFRLVNKYHVFPTMKTERLELEILGSRDGLEWRPYRFRYKPDDRLARRPPVVLPHHPRLDWMMWFVTVDPVFVPWFDDFLQALVAGSEPVLALLEANPFPEGPPRYLRVEVYDYRFTGPAERQETGQWWTREYLGPFPPLPWVERYTAEEDREP